MALQEINLETAIKLHEACKDVSVLRYDPVSKLRIVDSLDNLLSDAVFLADSNDVKQIDTSEVNQKQNQESVDTKSKEPSIHVDNNHKVEVDTSEITVKKHANRVSKSNPKKRKVDIGMLYAMHRAGRSAQVIADELGVHVQTVYKYLQNKELMHEVLSPTDPY